MQRNLITFARIPSFAGVLVRLIHRETFGKFKKTNCNMRATYGIIKYREVRQFGADNTVR